MHNIHIQTININTNNTSWNYRKKKYTGLFKNNCQKYLIGTVKFITIKKII